MPKSSADGIRWNLSDLYSSIKDPKIAADLAEAKKKAVEFEKRYKPLLPNAGGSASLELIPLLKNYFEIVELSTRPYVYAMLIFSADTKSAEHGALIQKMRSETTEIRAHILFWELAWSRLDKKIADKWMSHPDARPHRHYLEKLRKYEPHLLAEGEEKIADIKDNTGSRAFSRLFDEVTNDISFKVKLNGKLEEKTESEVLAMLHLPERHLRQEGHRSLTEGLKQNARVLTYVFNMILEDHKSECKIRRFDHPMAGRNLANEIGLEAVENLIRCVKAAYPAVVRYYKLKKKLLGLDVLFDYDRYAPVSDADPNCSFSRGKEIVRRAYHEFDPKAGEIIDLFFEKHWIDAELRSGKRGGAFCASTLPKLHPYVLTNYADKPRDVMTLAHELGHGIHQYLARGVGILEFDAPLTMAECASVFGEMLVFDKLMKEEKDERVRLSLLCGKIEDTFATVFRQIVMTDFELKIHAAIAKEGELTTDRYSDLWMEANRPMHGDAVTLTEEYRYWWLYIPHFIHTPFYCYAYSFAQLLVLSMYEKYRSERKRFVPSYIKLLSLGGSKSPEELCRLVDLDISNPGFWNLGLKLLDRMVDEAEQIRAVAHA